MTTTTSAATADFHTAIAEFVAEVVADHTEQNFDGTFGYRIDVYRADGTSMPFIYIDDRHYSPEA